MRIVVGADHAGFDLKQTIAEDLRRAGHEVIDKGTDSNAPVDYPDFAAAVGRAVLDGAAERGVLICGSGVGASVAANKLPGIRAGLCHDTYSAHQGVEHDDMNVLVLGARVIGVELARELVNTFPGGEIHRRRAPSPPPRKNPSPGARLRKISLEECKMNPLKALAEQGQSVWLDYIRRNLIRSGELKRLVEEDGIRGVTSNPTIFEKAIAGSTDYDAALRALLAENPNAEVGKLYEPLAVEDIQMAADVLRSVYDAHRRRRRLREPRSLAPFGARYQRHDR